MSLPTFGFVSVHREPLQDGVAREAEWMARCAASGNATAHLWQARAGFVVPRRYAALPGWRALDAAWSARIQVRASGGGLVPQGRGVWNLSLVWAAPSTSPVAIDAVYAPLCRELALAFARLGIDAAPQPVRGSFCDGRYNLAVAGRKLAGTAQAWRRIGGRLIVLAHAVVVVTADPATLTEQANALEAALGTEVRYRSDALTSVERAAADPADVEARTVAVLAEQFARVVPPRVLA